MRFIIKTRLVRKLLEDSKVKLKTIDDFTSDIFNPPPIKRIFVDNLKIGTPYMLPSEMFNFI